VRAARPGASRERILGATLVCVSRFGLAKVSRATIYRRFPGGREELVHALVVSEIGKFVGELAAAVAESDSLEEALAVTLVVARHALLGHAVLQKVLQTEPDRILPQLEAESPRVISYLSGLLRPYLAGAGVPAEVDPAWAADHLSRLVLSVTLSPGRWDLQDPSQLRRLVRGELLGTIGYRAPPSSP
jgi:AcrR family transcriptional regulator